MSPGGDDTYSVLGAVPVVAGLARREDGRQGEEGKTESDGELHDERRGPCKTVG
jgi:hypothetical protein